MICKKCLKKKADPATGLCKECFAQEKKEVEINFDDDDDDINFDDDDEEE